MKEDGKFDIVVVGGDSRYDIGLAPLDEAANAFETLGRIQQYLREREVMGKATCVLRDHNIDAALWVLDVADF